LLEMARIVVAVTFLCVGLCGSFRAISVGVHCVIRGEIVVHEIRKELARKGEEKIGIERSDE
jgi:hypothetical protein